MRILKNIPTKTVCKCWHCKETFPWNSADEYPSLLDWTCPYCGNDVEEAEECIECEEAYDREDMYEGLCESCAYKKVTPEDFLQFVEDDPTTCILEEFWFAWWYDGGQPPFKSYNADLHHDVVLLYQIQAEKDRAYNQHTLRDRIIDYMKDEQSRSKYTSILREYIEWVMSDEVGEEVNK